MAGRPQKRVLVFCRSYLVADFRENVAPLADKHQFEFLTDGACEGTADTRADFYAALNSGLSCSEIDPSIEDDVIARCRLLRNLERERARRLVHAMARTLDTKLSELSPDIVFCHWVDEYSLHLLSILARRRGIRFLAYASAYFPNLAQFTDHSNGQALNVREPSAEEVEKTLGLIRPNHFRQNYNQSARHSLLLQAVGVARYNVKRLVFKAKSILENDPWGMHYRITPYVVDRRNLLDFPSESLFEQDWQGALHNKKQERPSSSTVFLPLSYFPEASTDYWVSDRRILDYESTIIRVIQSLAPSCNLLVKEHPHMLGGRKPAFYQRLRSMDAVVSADPYAFSADALAASDAVVLGGGSVGIEAYLRNKPIFTYCDSSYWYGPSGATFLPLESITEWADTIRKTLASFEPQTDELKSEFVHECLRATMHIRKGGRRWPLVEPGELHQLLLNS